MKDTDCVVLLQWALPRLGLHWPGFRRVRRQVCKRIDRRIRVAGVAGPTAYMAYLNENPREWTVLDGLCTVSISRFYRDRAVFDCLRDTVLPELAAYAAAQTDPTVRCWSAGCASGEEPYTLSLMWGQCVHVRYPLADLAIVATDVDTCLLDRARVGCYSSSSLRELPQSWIAQAFLRRDDAYCLRDGWKSCVEFRQQDVRIEQPPGPFDLVFCRNLVFTYFDAPSQRSMLSRLTRQVRTNGFLVVGRHELLPPGGPFLPCPPGLGIYRRAP